MVASATDNKLLSALWHNQGLLSPDMDLSQYDDYTSAKVQLEYIINMAMSNPTWIGVATCAAQAEQIQRRVIHLGNQKYDDWKIASIEIQALGTPIKTWYAQYQQTLVIPPFSRDVLVVCYVFRVGDAIFVGVGHACRTWGHATLRGSRNNRSFE